MARHEARSGTAREARRAVPARHPLARARAVPSRTDPMAKYTYIQKLRNNRISLPLLPPSELPRPRPCAWLLLWLAPPTAMEVTTLLLMPAGFDLMLRTRSGETTMHSVPALGHVVDLLFEVDTQSILTL